MEATDTGFKLSTGLEFYAHASILGLGPRDEDDARLSITYGYDGSVDHDDNWSSNPQFTPAERQEIADYMIALWRAWAALPPRKVDAE